MYYDLNELEKRQKKDLIHIISSITDKFNTFAKEAEKQAEKLNKENAELKKQLAEVEKDTEEKMYQSFVSSQGEFLSRFIKEEVLKNLRIDPDVDRECGFVTNTVMWDDTKGQFATS